MSTDAIRKLAASGVFLALLAWAFERGGWRNAAFSAVVMATSASLAYLAA